MNIPVNKKGEVYMEKNQELHNELTKKKYLDELVNELMTDQEWEFPAECRFFLEADLEWTLLGM